LHGRGILKRGLIKRLGAGSSIDVWNDNWIPSNTSLKPMLKPDSATAIMVSELINDNDKPWNRDALVENFTPSDVEAIQKTLSRNLEEDVFAWAYERNGCYSFGSAYIISKDLQMAESDHKDSAPSDSNMQGLWWKHLWKMEVQPKVRIFGGELFIIFCRPNQFSRNII
jgi:hypothetical protein